MNLQISVKFRFFALNLVIKIESKLLCKANTNLLLDITNNQTEQQPDNFRRPEYHHPNRYQTSLLIIKVFAPINVLTISSPINPKTNQITATHTTMYTQRQHMERSHQITSQHKKALKNNHHNLTCLDQAALLFYPNIHLTKTFLVPQKNKKTHNYQHPNRTPTICYPKHVLIIQASNNSNKIDLLRPTIHQLKLLQKIQLEPITKQQTNRVMDVWEVHNMIINKISMF